eukprot:1832969-Prymnesium_polylepis.1
MSKLHVQPADLRLWKWGLTLLPDPTLSCICEVYGCHVTRKCRGAKPESECENYCLPPALREP